MLLRERATIIIYKAVKYKSSGDLLASSLVMILLPCVASDFADWQVLWDSPKPPLAFPRQVLV